MTCGYCRYLNLDDEHRCRRCGRPLALAVAAGGGGVYLPQPVAQRVALADLPRPPGFPPAAAPAGPPRQARLFYDGSKVVPIAEPPERPKPKQVHRSTVRLHARQTANEAQPSLDFLPLAPPAPRTLSTSVEAVIYCDAPVATPVHRALAGAIDAGFILIAFCAFLVTFYAFGGRLPAGKPMFLIWLAAAALITFFYGYVWVCCGAPTPGMRATRLTVINFDGYPPDDRSRWLRCLGACLSFCAGGLGILWALVDEESLAWHDHISQTFPTFRAPETNFVRRR